MAVASGVPRGNTRIHLEIDESHYGPCGFDAVLESFLEASALPQPLRWLHDRTAVVRVLGTTLRDEDLPFRPIVWLVLFPRSRGQDLTRDFSSIGAKTFPVVAYAYDSDIVKGALVMERMHDLGLGTVELAVP